MNDLPNFSAWRKIVFQRISEEACNFVGQMCMGNHDLQQAPNIAASILNQYLVQRYAIRLEVVPAETDEIFWQSHLNLNDNLFDETRWGAYSTELANGLCGSPVQDAALFFKENCLQIPHEYARPHLTGKDKDRRAYEACAQKVAKFNELSIDSAKKTCIYREISRLPESGPNFEYYLKPLDFDNAVQQINSMQRRSLKAALDTKCKNAMSRKWLKTFNKISTSLTEAEGRELADLALEFAYSRWTPVNSDGEAVIWKMREGEDKYIEPADFLRKYYKEWLNGFLTKAHIKQKDVSLYNVINNRIPAHSDLLKNELSSKYNKFPGKFKNTEEIGFIGRILRRRGQLFESYCKETMKP